MLLGDLLARLTDEATAAEAVLSGGDLRLLLAMRSRAEENGVSLGAYAAWAVRVYADNASPNEWTALMGAVARADDPGTTCLLRAFAYVLASAEPAC